LKNIFPFAIKLKTSFFFLLSDLANVFEAQSETFRGNVQFDVESSEGLQHEQRSFASQSAKQTEKVRV
jgi:hypothetical protein